jgi:hypothetical protein
MTNEELIGEAFKWAKNALPPEPWADTHIVLRLAHALELATTGSELTVEYEYRRVTSAGRIYFPTFESVPELNEGELAQRRTLGPWGVVE